MSDDVKRWPALYQPLGSLAGPEVATMVLASDYDALKTENERLREVLENVRHGTVCPAQVGWLDADQMKVRG